MISNEGDQSRGKPAADAYLDITPTFNDDLELSTVDKKWGCLFYGNTPTDRFGQLNRGIANHINELDTPKKTIVIPPRKMVEFYSRFELKGENYPLKTIFQNLSPKQISWLYEDLYCEYHLVGDGDVGKRPKIPALTPLGFDTWMTLFMLAYPNEEAERLQKIVEAMPIDADGVLVERKPERLPKQLSRHLLPPEAHRESKKTLDCVLSEFKDLATSNQTPSRNSKTSRLPPQHHNDLYSRELPTPQPRQERFAKTTLYSESSYHGQTNKTGNGRQTNNAQRGRAKPYVHNSRPNNDL